MIDYLRGKLVAAAPETITLEVGGVGLRIVVPPSGTLTRKVVGTEIRVYTRLFLREAEVVLYGFSSPLEKKVFNLITGISGFGPRLGLALLAVLSPAELYQAVLGEDSAALRRAPGVGRKTAQRLILELKEKMPALMGPGTAVVLPAGGTDGAEVVEALCALGYSRSEALSAVNRVEQDDRGGLTREELLKTALRSMADRLSREGRAGGAE